MEHELMTITEVAQRLSLSGSTVKYHESTGHLPALKLSTGERLFRRADVEKFAAARSSSKS
jgi:excisionase family DNA binding protein